MNKSLKNPKSPSALIPLAFTEYPSFLPFAFPRNFSQLTYADSDTRWSNSKVFSTPFGIVLFILGTGSQVDVQNSFFEENTFRHVFT